MKRYSLLLILLSCIINTYAQETLALDTIYANDQKNVALFFPEPIRQAITGSDNFVFTYNREKEQYFGLLQAKPGKESNLLVINRDGTIFSYIICYKKQLEKLNYFIPTDKSIGNERPIPEDIADQLDSVGKLGKSTEHYQKFCSDLLNQKPRVGTIKKRSEDIVLSIENIVFHRDELFFLVRIENKSTLDYDLNYLDFSVETRQKGRKKSMQRLKLVPRYTLNKPTKIAEGKTSRMVYVLPKFSLGNDRRVILELNESNGERDLKLMVSHHYINNPN